MGLKESWMNVFKDTVRLGRDLVTGTVETFRFGAEKINDWLNEEAAKKDDTVETTAEETTAEKASEDAPCASCETEEK